MIYRRFFLRNLESEDAAVIELERCYDRSLFCDPFAAVRVGTSLHFIRVYLSLIGSSFQCARGICSGSLAGIALLGIFLLTVRISV